MKIINIAIVNDSSLWKQIVLNELIKVKELRVQFTSEWSPEVLQKIKKVLPDYILLDTGNRDNCIDICNLVKVTFPSTPIIVLGMSQCSTNSDMLFFRSIGIKAYINKYNISSLCPVIRKIMGIDRSGYNFEPLSIDEMKLLQLVCRKLTNYSISQELNKSEKTIEKNLKLLSEKLGIENSKLALFEFAVKFGFWNVHSVEV